MDSQICSCGATLKQNSKFCSKCGSEVRGIPFQSAKLDTTAPSERDKSAQTAKGRSSSKIFAASVAIILVACVFQAWNFNRLRDDHIAASLAYNQFIQETPLPSMGSSPTDYQSYEQREQAYEKRRQPLLKEINPDFEITSVLETLLLVSVLSLVAGIWIRRKARAANTALHANGSAPSK